MELRYKVIIEDGVYALVERGEKYPEYAVVRGLVPKKERKYQGADWRCTVGYAKHTSEGLADMLDLLQYKTT